MIQDFQSGRKTRRAINPLATTISVLAAIATILFGIWKTGDVDATMRRELLQQARMFSAGIDSEIIGRLSGTLKDLKMAPYKKLKSRLVAAKKNMPECRFIYLLGMKKDNTVFFFADNEPPTSKDASPPGQTYGEASPELKGVFKTGKGITEGPLRDRWGIWISALVPLFDQKNHSVIGVLGMDVDASNWNSDLISRSSLHILMLLLILILLVQVLSVIRSRATHREHENSLQEQLREKEILLRETHHRIKNNLTAIGSMVYLQVLSSTNREATSILQNTVGMINGMGKLYEKMLIDREYSDIRTKAYLGDLIDSIATVFPGSGRITFEKDIEEFALHSTRMFPLGIILNELLTNTLKYAFEENTQGTVRITLRKNGNTVRFTVRDTGKGLPDDFNPDAEDRFGLVLVRMLCKQLNATFSLKNDNGTVADIEFPVQ